MADSPRIEELRRRVQSDPASIAFAALAEEYRRAGRFEEAVETCQTGLQRHPSYLSAHVTLGRSLLEVGRYEEAQEQLEHVLKLAPENLAAIRALAEIHSRRGDDGQDGVAIDAAGTVTAAPERPAADVRLTPDPGPVAPAPDLPLNGAAPGAYGEVDLTLTLAAPPPPAALAGLEGFLAAILRARAEQSAAR